MNDSTTYKTSVSIGDNILEDSDRPLKIEAVSEYKCDNCDKEITLDQVKHVVPNLNKTLTPKILTYLNKYRADYKLDTCMRKAHFIAQIGAETNFWEDNMKEGHNYGWKSSILNKHNFDREGTISEDELDSLFDHLDEIFKIEDKNGKKLSKSNQEIKDLVKDEDINLDIRKLYARYSGSKELSVIKKKNDKGIEEVDYKIILKTHKAFRIPLFSRMYAPYIDGAKDGRGSGNGDEKSRDGYYFCGKGIKQITGRYNYNKFSKYRNNNPFPDDPEGDIDFTEVTNSSENKGNFDKLADKDEVIYSVQAALWFFQKGNKKDGHYAEYWANEDNIYMTSKSINGGTNGLKKRYEMTKKARSTKAFDVYNHYEQAYENGDSAAKKDIKDKLDEISKKKIRRKIDLKDPEAKKLLNKLKKAEEDEKKKQEEKKKKDTISLKVANGIPKS